MSNGLSPEQRREDINAAGGKVAREVLAQLCENMLENSVRAMDNYLRMDRETFDLYAKSGFPAQPEVKVHVYPNIEEQVLHDLDPDRTMLEMILTPKEYVVDQGSRLRILIPSPFGYAYPEPLQEPIFPEEKEDEAQRPAERYLPREIFVELIPSAESGEEPSRYAISQAEVRRYDISLAGDSVVETEFSDQDFAEFLQTLQAQRVPNSLGTIVNIFSQFYNYDVAEARSINITIGPDPEEDPNGGAAGA